MKSFTLSLRGEIRQFDKPLVMGILNATPDSFYAESRKFTEDSIARRVETMLEEGCDIIDLGAYSSRPGADDVSPDEERRRLDMAMATIRKISTAIPVSIDTFRASIAEFAVRQLDADIINDISGGDIDPDMFPTVGRLNVPYVLMHMRGTPETMQQLTNYDNEGGVTAAVVSDLSLKIKQLELLGVNDIIVDPGFGFSKTVQQNWRLMRQLPEIAAILERPILVGISRKSMLTKPLSITPAEALEATTAANMAALMGGAAILRVHDVKAARQTVDVASLLMNS